MFDLGIQELILIFVVVLVVYGPKRMPEIARAIGKGIAEVKRSLESVKTEIDTEMKEVKDLKDFGDPISLKNEIFKSESLIKPYEEEADLQKKSEPAVNVKAAGINENAESIQHGPSDNTKKQDSSAEDKTKQGRKV